MKKITFITFAVLTLTATLFVACSGNKDNNEAQGAPVKVAIVYPIYQSQTGVVGNGQVQSKEIARLGTRMMGTVTSIKVKKGDTVSKGQLLLTISDEELGAKKAQAEAMIREAQAAYDLAKKDEERFAAMLSRKTVSTKEYENVHLQMQSMKSKLDMAKQMKKEVQANQAYTQITAPFSGVISQINIDLGALANPGMPLIVVEKGSDWVVESSITESDIAKIKKGMKAIVRVKSVDISFEAPITEISRSSVETGGQYKLTVEVPAEQKAKLYSGMYANILVPIETSQSAVQQHNLLIPSQTVVDKDGLTGVYVVSSSETALLRWVRLGQTVGDQTEVLSGLKKDDRVILPEGKRLENGMKVQTSK